MLKNRSIIIFLIFSLIGCRSGSLNVTHISLFDSFNQKKFEDFRRRCSFHVLVSKNANINNIVLSEVPKKLLIKFKVPEADKVLYIKMEENDRVNINRHMIQGQEYMFDKHNTELMILLDIPLVYLLEGEIVFDFNILLFHSKRETLLRIQKSVSFLWASDWLYKDGEIRFHYEVNSKASERIEMYFKLKRQASKELRNTNLNRFKTEYRKKVLKFAN